MQSTLDKEKEVVNLLVEKINEHTNDKVQVISSTDFTEERGQYIIVVAITNSNQMNFGLPDYQYTVQINIDCFIKCFIRAGKSKGNIVNTFRKVFIRHILSGLSCGMHRVRSNVSSRMQCGRFLAWGPVRLHIQFLLLKGIAERGGIRKRHGNV